MNQTPLYRLQGALDPLVRRFSLRQRFHRGVLQRRLPARAYWWLAPRAHRLRRHLSPGYVDRPLQPFALMSVDPDRIVRFSAREYPIWRNRWQLFGAVRGGEWDRRHLPPLRSYDGPDLSVYLADRFVETPLHDAFRQHFDEGVPWEEVPLIQEFCRRARAEDGQSVWHTCHTPSEVRQRCRDMDQLYESMSERGCLSRRRLNAESGRNETFRHVMVNEILVDIGRDGELLFVTGRHRLSLAKLLGLERIPVAVVVRHADWLQRLHEAMDGNVASTERGPLDSAHPDIRHVLGASSEDASW